MCNIMCGIICCVSLSGLLVPSSRLLLGGYFPDKYMEFDIGELPPGEVMQIAWHGNPLFVRRLTKEEMDDKPALFTSLSWIKYMKPR